VATPRFAFLHVGAELQIPALLVASLRKYNPGALIVQCTDHRTPEVPGVDITHRVDGDSARLMTFRLEAFADLPSGGAMLYLDTDMLCMGAVAPENLLGGNDAVLCKREFGRDGFFNAHYRGLDLAEYKGMRLAQVYPYVACATVTSGPGFWADCASLLHRLDEKFHRWFGDQEALREIVRRGEYRVGELPESLYGCPPEELASVDEDPLFVHFKGSKKPQMLAMARILGL
jgi:hypothetical protein